MPACGGLPDVSFVAEPRGIGVVAGDAGLDLGIGEGEGEGEEQVAVLGAGTELRGVCAVERLGRVRAEDLDLGVCGAVAVKVRVVVGAAGGGQPDA